MNLFIKIIVGSLIGWISSNIMFITFTVTKHIKTKLKYKKMEKKLNSEDFSKENLDKIFKDAEEDFFKFLDEYDEKQQKIQKIKERGFLKISGSDSCLN